MRYEPANHIGYSDYGPYNEFLLSDIPYRFNDEIKEFFKTHSIHLSRAHVYLLDSVGSDDDEVPGTFMQYWVTPIHYDLLMVIKLTFT